MSFNPEVISLLERGREDPYAWVLSGQLVYGGMPRPATVPDGFVTDLASVPRILTWLIPRYGLYTKAAVVHDFLCQTGPDRFEADQTFLNGMTELGVPWLRKHLMWSAVTWATVGGYLLRRWIWTLVALLLLGAGVVAVRPFAGWWLPAWVALALVVMGILAAAVVAVPDRKWRRFTIVLRAIGWTIPGLPLLLPAVPLALLLGLYLVVENPGGAFTALGRWVSAPFAALRKKAPSPAPEPMEDLPSVTMTPRQRRLAALIG